MGGEKIPNAMGIYTHAAKTGEGHTKARKMQTELSLSFRSRWSNRDQIFSPKQLENGQNKHLQSTGYEAVKDRDLW